MKTFFDVADEVIKKAYPDIANKGKGWWGASRVPNCGILRGAIARALKDASQPSDPADAKICANCGSTHLTTIYHCLACGIEN